MSAVPAESVAGVVLAGGAGSRLGGDKALLPFGGGTLLDAVIARAAPQVSQLAISVSAAAPAHQYRYPQYPLLLDAYPERRGPLAGIVAGLEWLRTLGGPQWLASFPCDSPFLPRDLVAQLMPHASDAPVFARDAERLHGIFALWPLACSESLRAGVESSHLRSVHSAMEELGGKTCLIRAPEYAFFNINTKDDLARAEQLTKDEV
jgi:molybdopterin-guanine dinucleotide biosynthesis protein A